MGHPRIYFGRTNRMLKKIFGYNRKVDRAIFILMGLVPTFVWFFFMFFYPIFRIFKKSFYDWNLAYQIDQFIGFENFIELTNDRVFLISLENTFFVVIYIVPATIILSLLVAILLNNFGDNIREFFTPIYFLPVITSMVAVGIVWKWLYHPSYGLFNYLLQLVGLPIQPFLNSPKQALESVSGVVIWRNIGYFAVIILAALRGIPNSYYEAAKIAGANKWQEFRHITLPLLKPTLLFTSIMAIIRAFKIFIPIQIMTDGGPGNSSMVLVLNIYKNGFEFLEMGYAAAMTVVLFFVIMIITAIQWLFIRSE